VRETFCEGMEIAAVVALRMTRSGLIPKSWQEDAVSEARAALLARVEEIGRHPNPTALARLIARNAVIDFDRRMRFRREIPFSSMGFNPETLT